MGHRAHTATCPSTHECAHACNVSRCSSVPHPGSAHTSPAGSHWPGPGLSSLPRTEQGEFRGHQRTPQWHQAEPLSPGGTQGHTWQDGAGLEGHAKLESVTHHHGAPTGLCGTGTAAQCCSCVLEAPSIPPAPAGAAAAHGWCPSLPALLGSRLPAPRPRSPTSLLLRGTRITTGSLLAPGGGTWPEAPAGPAQPGPLLPGFRCPRPRPCAVSPARENGAEEGASKDPRGLSPDPTSTRSRRDPSCCPPLPGGTGEADRPRDAQHARDWDQHQSWGTGMCSTTWTGTGTSPGAPLCPKDRDRHRHRVTRMRSTAGTGIGTSPGAPGRAAPPGYRDMQHPRG